MIKTIIFDFDGTLADTFNITLNYANAILEKLGHKPIEDAEEFHDKSIHDIIKESGISRLQLIQAARKVRSFTKNNYVEHIELFNGINLILNELSKKYKIGILTSNSRKTVFEVLSKKKNNVDFIYRIRSLDIALSRSLLAKYRPLRRLLKRNKLKKDEVIYIGDEIRDIEACKKLEIPIIAVTWGYNSKKALQEHNPDYIIDKPQQLLEVFTQIS